MPKLPRPDALTIALVAVVTLASLVPIHGEAVHVFTRLTHGAIALLFFLHGTKLAADVLRAGLLHWRLHVTIFAATFVMFPLFGLALRPLALRLLPTDLATGLFFVCVLPATVQSAIAFTATARGNVAAAVCSASASTMLGVFVTPALAMLLLPASAHYAISYDQIGAIALQVLLPFVVGQLVRRVLDQRTQGRFGVWLQQPARAAWLRRVDQVSILLLVYLAFSEAVSAGLWRSTTPRSLALLLAFCVALLTAALLITNLVGKWLGFALPDRIALIFCGSKKSLASGVPIASVLFPVAVGGAVLLPLMVFHQLQLMVCAALASRYARLSDA